MWSIFTAFPHETVSNTLKAESFSTFPGLFYLIAALTRCRSVRAGLALSFFRIHIRREGMEKLMLSRESFLAPGPLFRGASPRSNRRDSGPRTEVHIPEQEYPRRVVIICIKRAPQLFW